MLSAERQEWIEYRVLETSDLYVLQKFVKHWVGCGARRILLFGMSPGDDVDMFREILKSLDMPVQGKIVGHKFKIDQHGMRIDDCEFPFIWRDPSGFDARGFWQGFSGLWCDAVWAYPGVDVFDLDGRSLIPRFNSLFEQIKGVANKGTSLDYSVSIPAPDLNQRRNPWMSVPKIDIEER